MNVEVPEEIRQAAAALAPEAELRLAAASDLGADGRYGERWLVLAGERLLVLAPAGTQPRVLVDRP